MVDVCATIASRIGIGRFVEEAMKPLSHFQLACCAAMIAVCLPTDSALSEQLMSLGGHPLCEASAATLLPCPDADGTCLLVGDNEVRDELFLYRLENGRVSEDSRQSLSLDSILSGEGDREEELSDIEALAPVSPNEIAIFGSHSRNSACDTKKKRRQYLHAELQESTLVEGSLPPVKSKKHSCKRLFGRPLDELKGTLRSVCDAIETAEGEAEAAFALSDEVDQREACSSSAAFNLEGAVAVPAENGDLRVWIGLRAPLVDNKAVLLRQISSRETFQFDIAVLVDLGGFGVRDLTYAHGQLWGIAGPPTDADDPHRLWRFAPETLADDTVIEPQHLGELPNFSEGLAIHEDTAIVLLDGDEGDEAGSCAVDSQYMTKQVDIPAP